MHRSAPPAWLDPLLALVERVDRGVRRLRPVTPDGVLALERRRHRGPSLTLSDGTRVRAGDRIGVVHLRNDRVRSLTTPGWLTAGTRIARDDLLVLSTVLAAMPPERRPVAFRGVTLLAPLARRFGWEARGPRTGLGGALEGWYQAGLLARWSALGRDRLSRGRRREPVEMWISTPELMRRFGAAVSTDQ